MTRQGILTRDDEPRLDQAHTPLLWVILDESVLHRVVGSPAIMKEQREYLASMIQPNVIIQVVPYSRRATCAFGRAFTVFVSRSDSLVYPEDVRSARYIRVRDEIGRYAVTFDHLRASALDEDESIKLIKGDYR